MVRFFPRTTRRRVTAAASALSALSALVACSMVLVLAGAPLASAEDHKDKASAEDLKDKKAKVKRDLSGAHTDLEHSSDQLRAATAALAAAEVQLSKAQAHLAESRGELAAAEALDPQMQAELDVAILRLEQAQADLAQGQLKIAEQEQELGEIVVENYQTGDPSLMGLSMVLNSQDPSELTGQLNSVQNVIDKEAVSLSKLEASRVLLTVQEQEVEEARVEVAARRRAAALNLVAKQELEQQAEAAELQVQNLVALREEAENEADKARLADLATLESLEKERERIAKILRKRAEAAQARAAAAVAAATLASANAIPVRGNGYLSRPVTGYITSPFGWRTHPIYGYRALHDGIDYGAACGTPISAPASGTVIARYYQSAYGNRLIVDHGLRRGVGVATTFNHATSYVVSQGDRVRRGQVIGFVGTTGWSTGCHLHFSVLQNGSPVNPMGWL
ncbi:hypothetical protein BH18ACT9_BH18ACT9_13120 [soil metagenome]